MRRARGPTASGKARATAGGCPFSLVLALAPMILTTTTGWSQQSSYQVVVNRANPVTSLAASEVSALLLKKQSSWADGVAVEPVDLSPSSPVRAAFSEEVHGRPVAAVKSYWQTQLFSGALVPPPEVVDDAAVIAFVGEHRGGIGYVAAGPVEGVKVVSLTIPPFRTSHVQPRYPAAAERVHAVGDVLLRLTVSSSGEVAHVEVLQGQPWGMTEEAVRAVKGWRYRPATSGGHLVEATVEVTVHFGLQ